MTMVLNLYCQLGWTSNHLEDKVLKRPAIVLADRLAEDRRPTLNTGSDISWPGLLHCVEMTREAEHQHLPLFPTSGLSCSQSFSHAFPG